MKRFLSRHWWPTVFVGLNLIMVLCVAAWADRPYIDVPASRLNLVVKEFRLVNDDQGIPFVAEVTWLYKADLGDIQGKTTIWTKDLWKLWNASRTGWNLDQLTDYMIKQEAQRKGLQIQGSVSNIIPYLVTEINVSTNVTYTDATSNTIDRVDVIVETNEVFKSLSSGVWR
jgi:hypothetical protein